MTDPTARRTFTSLIAAACIDRKVTQEEKRFLHRKASTLQIPPPEVEEMIREGMEGRFTLSIPPTEGGKQQLLDELLDVVCIDGKLESFEKSLLTRYASVIGIDAGDIGQRALDRLSMNRNANRDDPARSRRREPAPDQAGTRHPEPIRFLDPSRTDSQGPMDHQGSMPVNPLGSRGDNLLSQTVGPIKLGGATSLGTDDLGPISRELVKNVLRYDGRDEAINYVQKTCGVTDPAKAAAIVDRISAEDPSCAPGSSKVKHGR